MNVHTYVGEIRMFAGEHPPEGWVFCDGRLLSSGDYHALYALIYDSFGGDHEHFAVPDLRGRVPIHMGTQPGKVQIQLAHKGGAEKVVLTDQHVPPHNHTVYGVTDEAKQAKPSVKFMATPKTLVYAPAVTEDQKVPMKAGSIAKSGTPGYAISTVQPYQAINFIIALDGEFPPATNLNIMENFIGEIRMFPYGNLPRGWYYCDGRILNTDGEAKNLFGYIQFTYGGNGTTTFALPDLRGTLALCANNIDPNRPMRQLGLAGGSLTNQLVEANLPAHTHAVNTYTGGTGNSSIVAGKCLAYLSLADEDSQYADGGAGKMVKMDPKMLLSTRVATSYSIEQPVLGLMFAIAYQGIYPTRP